VSSRTAVLSTHRAEDFELRTFYWGEGVVLDEYCSSSGGVHDFTCLYVLCSLFLADQLNPLRMGRLSNGGNSGQDIVDILDSNIQ
jgi:hypothetical protein